PPVQDEKLPDQVVKEEAGPLMQDEAGADSRMVEPDSVPEETQLMLEEPVLDADYLTEENPETEQEPEPEITAIQMNRNSMSVEEAVL
ncbi:hypothetical protein M9458_020907, partial [Cirrhinus mrigala]